MNEQKAKVKLIITFFAFGLISLIVKYVDVPSSVISAFRGVFGAISIFISFPILKKSINWESIKKNIFTLVLTGTIMGFNWAIFFESYNYTSVAIATVCYYMQPIFLMIGSVIFLNEKFTSKKIVCLLVAILGMVFVTGVLNGTSDPSNKPIGAILGVFAGFMYAVVVLINKKMKDIPASECTMVQLAVAGTVMTIYSLFTVDRAEVDFNLRTIILLLVLAVVLTGLCYTIYFDSIKKVPAQTVGILGYIDPITSVLCSAIVLGEPLGMTTIIGAIFILGSTFVSEINFKKKEIK